MINTVQMTVLQITGGIIPEWSMGMALLYVGLFVALTLLTMRLASAAAILSWALTGSMLMLVVLEAVSDELYFIVLALAFLTVGATGAYNAT